MAVDVDVIAEAAAGGDSKETFGKGPPTVDLVGGKHAPLPTAIALAHRTVVKETGFARTRWISGMVPGN